MGKERKRRVLILTVTAGNGHNACARAMAEELERAGTEVKIIDYLKAWADRRTVWMVDRGYSLSVAHALRIYNRSYRWLKRRPPEERFRRKFAQKIALEGAEGLLREVYAFCPDVIYCTHFYPATALTDLRLLVPIPAKCYVTLLDYSFNPFWECCIGVDHLNLPTSDLTEEALRLGYRRGQLLYSGIPVAAKFAPADRRAARREPGLDGNAFTVMVMFGGGQWSGGYTIFRQVVRAVQDAPVPVQIVMLNGRNEADRRRIARESAQGKFGGVRVHSVGFTDRVELYMAASDAIVTKLGGTGATECINRGLPIIAAAKLLPRQEADNAVYLREKGAALLYRNERELREQLTALLTDESLRGRMLTAQRAMAGGGVRELAAHIMAQPFAGYGEEPDFLHLRERIAAAMKRALREETAKARSLKNAGGALNSFNRLYGKLMRSAPPRLRRSRAHAVFLRCGADGRHLSCIPDTS